MPDKKGARTRRNITYAALQLFSVKGYFHTSISDILHATKLTKGGLYCHFQSKEDIWYAVYEEALSIWREIVFKNLRHIQNPIERIERTCNNVLERYLAADTFDGGCFFVNMLVELPGQSATMSRHILRGFVGFSKLFQAWLAEADQQQMLRPDLDFKDVANFLVITLNGAATLYVASRDKTVLRQTAGQLQFYLQQLIKI
jgi:TetR/AcrR family transcriptional regulator, transcriptional repressor for nem operon